MGIFTPEDRDRLRERVRGLASADARVTADWE